MSKLIKIALLGGECTGKTTLCKQLTLHYGAHTVNEVARRYISELQEAYSESDLWQIAVQQQEEEKKIAKVANRLLFCDTSLEVIKVWSEHSYGGCHRNILNQIAKENYDAYFIMKPDLPWKYDVQREHPLQKDREYFYRIYLDIASHSNIPFVIIQGVNEMRLSSAISFIEKMLHAK